MLSLLEKEINENNKISKPDFETKVGREFLAFYLNLKLKQIVNFDKNSETPFIKEISSTLLSRFTRRLIDNPEKHIMIGITGESASGKSTICNEIKKVSEELNLPIEIINADNYFNDISDKIAIYGDFDKLRDSGYDVDSPESFQLDLLKSDLEKLAYGEDIKMPQYLLNGTGVSVPNSIPATSKKIIVVEGMAALYKDVADIFDVKFFVDIDKEIQKKWFLNRAKSRNQDMENAYKHWEYVNIASKKYIAPLKETCDVILDGKSSLSYVAQIMRFIHAITNNYSEE